MGVIIWPWVIVALCSLILLPVKQYPELANDPELAYPMMMIHVLPPVLTGIMVASFLAAFMSSMDTVLNLSASYLVNDVYRRLLVKTAHPAHYVTVGRVVMVCIVIIIGIIAYNSKSVLKLSQFLVQITGGIGAVFVLRWFWWRINAWSEISAYVSSLIFGIVFKVKVTRAFFHKLVIGIVPDSMEPTVNNFFLDKLTHPEIGWAYGLAAVAGLTTIIFLTVTLLTKPTEREHLRTFYRKIKPIGPGWKEIAKECGPLEYKPGEIQFDWKHFLSGIIFFYSLFVALGRLPFGLFVSGGIAGVIAVISGYYLFKKWAEMNHSKDSAQLQDSE